MILPMQRLAADGTINALWSCLKCGRMIGTRCAIRLFTPSAWLHSPEERRLGMAAKSAYLVILEFHRESDATRIATDAPQLLKVLKDCATGKTEQAFRSSDFKLISWVLESNLSADQIKREFAGSMNTSNKDQILVFELGADLSATQGFSRVATWHQHHA
jgi:hypothetical protein